MTPSLIVSTTTEVVFVCVLFRSKQIVFHKVPIFIGLLTIYSLLPFLSTL